MLKSVLIILLLISFNFTGCRSGTEETLPVKNGFTTNYIVDTLNAGQLKEKIKNRGDKILVINFWATWCVPCVEEFPSLVKLAENYKNEDVEFLSLSVDLVKEINSAVIPFLQKQKVNFPVYVIPEKESEKVISLVEPDWNGAIPATAFFNKKGKLIDFVTGIETYESFRKKIDEALKF